MKLYEGSEKYDESLLLSDQLKTISRMKEKLSYWYSNKEVFQKIFPKFKIRPYQYEKVMKLLVSFGEQKKGNINKQFIADITPPSGGKTFMMILLAKLMQEEGIPSVVGMWNTTNMTGPDNALNSFSRVFGKENIGMVDKNNKVFDKAITLITASSFSKYSSEFLQYHQKLNLMLDEGDTFQTDLRQGGATILLEKLPHFASMYSGTTFLGGKDINDLAYISDNLSISDYISLGYAKHIVGSYYTGEIEITKDKVLNNELDYNKLLDAEKKWMTQASLDIYINNHLGEKAIIHCSNVTQAKETCKLFLKEGIHAQYVTGKTPQDERDKIEDQYIYGDIDVLININVYLRAFSDKGVTQVQIYPRVSGSVSNVYQPILRGLRPHDDFDTLYIYQLLPSTIEHKGFIPVLMHDVFHIDPSDLNKRIHKGGIGPTRNKLPITFSETADASCNTEGSNKQDNNGNGTNNDGKTLSYISKDELLQFYISNHAGTFLEKKVDAYILENFHQIINNYFEENDKNVFDIPSIDRKELLNYEIKIFQEEVIVTRREFFKIVFSTISGQPKKMYDKHIKITTKRIQEWISTGEPPVYNGRIELYKLKELNKQTLNFKNEFIEKHAYEIFSLFIEEIKDIKEERPDKYGTEELDYRGLDIKYGTLLINSLKSLTGCDFVIAKNRPKLANNLMREWKKTGIKPTKEYATNELVKTFVVNDYRIRDFNNILQTFLNLYGIEEYELQSCVLFDSDEIVMHLDKHKVEKYLSWKADEETDENSIYKRYAGKATDDFSLDIKVNWRFMMREFMRNSFTSSLLKKYNKKWGDVNCYHKGLQNKLINVIKNKFVSPEIILALIADGGDDCHLPNVKEYLVLKNIDDICISNDIQKKIKSLNVKNCRKQNIIVKSGNRHEEMSLVSLTNYFINGLIGISSNKIISKLGLNSWQGVKYLSTQLDLYLSLNASERKSFTKDTIIENYTNFHEIHLSGDTDSSKDKNGRKRTAILYDRKENVSNKSKKDELENTDEINGVQKLPKNPEHQKKIDKYTTEKFLNEEKEILDSMKLLPSILSTKNNEKEYIVSILDLCWDKYPGKSDLEIAWYGLGNNKTSKECNIKETLTARVLIYIDYVKKIGVYEGIESDNLTYLYNSIFEKNKDAISDEIIDTHKLRAHIFQRVENPGSIRGLISELCTYIFQQHRRKSNKGNKEEVIEDKEEVIEKQKTEEEIINDLFLIKVISGNPNECLVNTEEWLSHIENNLSDKIQGRYFIIVDINSLKEIISSLREEPEFYHKNLISNFSELSNQNKILSLIGKIRFSLYRRKK